MSDGGERERKPRRGIPPKAESPDRSRRHMKSHTRLLGSRE